MQYEAWDFENDCVDTKQKLLFPPKTAQNYMGTAYAVETAVGIFYQKMRPDGKFNLMHIGASGEQLLMEDVTVVASDMKYTCIIVYLAKTCEFVLIDTRGVFYILEVNKESVAPAMFSMRMDRKTGFYEVGPRNSCRWMIRGISKKKQFENMMKFAPTGAEELNPKFKGLFKKAETSYLYLTILNSKKGKLIDYLINNVLPYEELPNMLIGDTTRNIRIPINEETLQMREMHFLMEKYYNTYAIQGIPIETILGTLEIDYKYKSQLNVYCQSASESQYPKVVSLINTIKMLYELESDLDVYKKVVKKIINLFPILHEISYDNYFAKLLLPYPDTSFRGYEIQQEILKADLEYVNNVLLTGRPIVDVAAISRTDMICLYQEVYKLSKEYYKAEMKRYEDEMMKMTE